jgi:hypothetical protein
MEPHARPTRGHLELDLGVGGHDRLVARRTRPPAAHPGPDRLSRCAGQGAGDDAVPDPLSELQYVALEDGDPPKITVLRDDGGPLPVIEILRTVPQPGVPAATNPTGVITITAADGSFRYKLRPASETSIIFGTIGKEIDVRIRDREIVVGEGSKLQSSTVMAPVGLLVTRESVALGAGPTPAMERWMANGFRL